MPLRMEQVFVSHLPTEEIYQTVRHKLNGGEKLTEQELMHLMFSGLLVITDKFIDKADAEKIRREITMTKVGRLIYEDGLMEGEKRGEERGEERGKKKERITAVVNMMRLDIPEDKILKMYTEEELKAAKEAMEQRA